MMNIPFRTFFTFLLFTLIFGGMMAQGGRGQRGARGSQSFQLVGKIIDQETSDPLEFATISLIKPADSSIVAGGLTDAKGNFELEAGAGAYILRVSFLGYETLFQDGIVLDAEKPFVRLEPISLAIAVTELDEVEISARKSRLEFSLDKKVFNVGEDLSKTGGNTADLLDNIPSVAVDIDGNVSLRGSDGVTLLIDGKPSGLTSINSADALQQLPANLVDKVEIITNPSSRYQAEGTAGIINIVLKKDERRGWNGTFDLNTGYPHRHSAAVNMNYRTEKFNFFGTTGIRYRKTPRQSFEHREIYSDTNTYVLDQENQSFRGGLSGNLRLGADYHWNDKNTLTASVNLRQSLDFNTGDLTYLMYDDGVTLSDVTIRETEEDEMDRSFDYSLNYDRKFARKDQRFTVDLIYTSGGETEGMDAREIFLNAERQPLGIPELQQRIDNSEFQNQTTLKSDYVHPFGKDGKWEAGYMGSIRNIGNTYQVKEFNEDTRELEILESLSNDFDYQENVQALYSNIGNKYNRFSYQAGVRWEYSYIYTLLKDTDEENTQEYNNFFPSVFLNYELQEGNAVQLSYSRRLRRPRFWDLNPFFNYSNPLSIRSGNPNLAPEFTHSFETSYLKYWDKASLSTSIYYRHTDGVITRLSIVDEEGINRMQPYNAATRDDLGAEFSLNVNPTKKIDLTWSGNVYYGSIDAENIGFRGQTQFFSYTSRLNARMELPGEIDMQIMVNFRGREATPQGERKAILYSDIGLSKDILKDKATINMRLFDPFNLAWYRYEAMGETFYLYREGQWRSRRQITLGFTYRLNQQKKRGRGGRGGGGNGGGGFDDF